MSRKCREGVETDSSDKARETRGDVEFDIDCYASHEASVSGFESRSVAFRHSNGGFSSFSRELPGAEPSHLRNTRRAGVTLAVFTAGASA